MEQAPTGVPPHGSPARDPCPRPKTPGHHRGRCPPGHLAICPSGQGRSGCIISHSHLASSLLCGQGQVHPVFKNFIEVKHAPQSRSIRLSEFSHTKHTQIKGRHAGPRRIPGPHPAPPQMPWPLCPCSSSRETSFPNSVPHLPPHLHRPGLKQNLRLHDGTLLLWPLVRAFCPHI